MRITRLVEQPLAAFDYHTALPGGGRTTLTIPVLRALVDEPGP